MPPPGSTARRTTPNLLPSSTVVHRPSRKAGVAWCSQSTSGYRGQQRELTQLWNNRSGSDSCGLPRFGASQPVLARRFLDSPDRGAAAGPRRPSSPMKVGISLVGAAAVAGSSAARSRRDGRSRHDGVGGDGDHRVVEPMQREGTVRIDLGLGCITTSQGGLDHRAGPTPRSPEPTGPGATPPRGGRTSVGVLGPTTRIRNIRAKLRAPLTPADQGPFDCLVCLTRRRRRCVMTTER